MFYSQVILARKGPLGKIWLAAHFDKKLTKNQIFSTDISDSVESVLKSTNPLALRVSGHLMLGIVRIYNRKVKYLISDCTEAMWKIKLAFRPGNVNMLEAQFAILNQIDDQRYFGRINPDAEFPELEDAGYSEAMLANDATLKAARNRSLGSKHDTTQDYDNDRFNHSSKSFSSPSMLSNDELLIIPSFAYSNDKSKERKNTLSSKDSTVSSIEKARKITNLGRSENRLSYATAGTAMAMSFDDDIPAFEENIDLAINMADINIFPPPLNIEDINEPIHSMHSIDTSTLEVPLLPDDNEISLSDKVVNSATEFESTQEIMKEPRKARVVNPRKIKKQRVQVDERVELSNRDYKNMLENVADILRRRPTDPLRRITRLDHDVNSTPTPFFQDLCGELQQLFQVAISSSAHASGSHASSDGESYQSPLTGDQSHEQNIELTRQHQKSVISEKKSESPYENIRSSEIQENVGSNEDYHPFLDTGDLSRSSPQVGSYVGMNDYGLRSPEITMDENHTLSALMKSRSPVDSSSDITPSTYVHSAAEVLDNNNPDKWNSRTKIVLDILKIQFDKESKVSFHTLSAGATRRVVASCFQEVLQLKTWGYIEVDQAVPFDDIYVTPTESTWAIVQQ